MNGYNGIQHPVDLCFFVDSDLYRQRPKSSVLTHIATITVILLTGGFAFPVLQLFLKHLRNILAGQTSGERLGKQQGKKVELTSLYNVNELKEGEEKNDKLTTKYFFREAIREA